MDGDIWLMPFHLKEGDIISFWDWREMEEDDFSTDEDLLAQERVKNLKLMNEGRSGGKKEDPFSIDVPF